MVARDLGMDVEWRRYDNAERTKKGQDVLGRGEVSRLIDDELELQYQAFKKAGLCPEDEASAWAALAQWVNDHELSEAGQQRLNRLAREFGLHQIAAVTEDLIFMSDFKLEVVTLLPTLKVIWRSVSLDNHRPA